MHTHALRFPSCDLSYYHTQQYCSIGISILLSILGSNQFGIGQRLPAARDVDREKTEARIEESIQYMKTVWNDPEFHNVRHKCRNMHEEYVLLLFHRATFSRCNVLIFFSLYQTAAPFGLPLVNAMLIQSTCKPTVLRRAPLAKNWTLNIVAPSNRGTTVFGSREILTNCSKTLSIMRMDLEHMNDTTLLHFLDQCINKMELPFLVWKGMGHG